MEFCEFSVTYFEHGGSGMKKIVLFHMFCRAAIRTSVCAAVCMTVHAVYRAAVHQTAVYRSSVRTGIHAAVHAAVLLAAVLGGTSVFTFSLSASENGTIQISESQWLQMNAEVEAIKLQLAEKERKDSEKAEAEKRKAWETPQVKLFGRFYFDAAAGNENSDAEDVLGGFTSGVKCRTARLGVKGTFYDMLEYESEFDFTGKNSVTLKNVYAGFMNLPGGVDFRVGHFKEPWSQENLTSSRSLVMMERSSLNSTKEICGGRNLGVMAHNWHSADRWTWAAGVFQASMPESLDGAYHAENAAFTARTTFLPFYEKTAEGRLHLLHVGGSFSARCFDREDALKNGTSFKIMPDSSIAPSVMNAAGSSALDGLDSLDAFLVESSVVHGPWSVDFEQAFFMLDDAYAGSADIQAGYVQCAWVLTGESRNYKKAGGYYGDLEPASPFVRTCRDGVGVFSGPGAWELAYRCGWMELGELSCARYDASGMKLGRTLNHAFGLNWYLNKNCRMMFNYVLSNTDYTGKYAGKEGTENVFQTRFQIAF